MFEVPFKAPSKLVHKKLSANRQGCSVEETLPIITTDASASTIMIGSTPKTKEEDANGTNPAAAAADTVDDAKSTNGKEQEGPTPVASVREVFSFARTRKVRLYIASSFFFAAVSGCVMPGTFYVCGPCWREWIRKRC